MLEHQGPKISFPEFFFFLSPYFPTHPTLWINELVAMPPELNLRCPVPSRRSRGRLRQLAFLSCPWLLPRYPEVQGVSRQTPARVKRTGRQLLLPPSCYRGFFRFGFFFFSSTEGTPRAAHSFQKKPAHELNKGTFQKSLSICRWEPKSFRTLAIFNTGCYNLFSSASRTSGATEDFDGSRRA